MWQVLSPSPPPGQFYLNFRYVYCELALGEGARHSPARPCIPLVFVRWEPGTDGRADWRGEKLMVVLTGNIFLWHFIAVEIWSTWFAQITNIKWKFFAEFYPEQETQRLSLLMGAALLALSACQSPPATHPPGHHNTLGLHGEFPQTLCSLVLVCFPARQWLVLLAWLSDPKGRQKTCFMSQEIVRQGGSRQPNACLSPGLGNSLPSWG